tara:strand:- start:342 stop:773 length:432 start_codon:yes stop_codon:yes gene_type:complete
MMSREEIDKLAEELESLKEQKDAIAEKLSITEAKIYQEFDRLSSETNMATILDGNHMTVKRQLKNAIGVDDARAAFGELDELSQADFIELIRPERERMVWEPAKVMMNKVRELKKKGGPVADLLEQITTKVSNGVRIINKGAK